MSQGQAEKLKLGLCVRVPEKNVGDQKNSRFGETLKILYSVGVNGGSGQDSREVGTLTG